MALRAFQTTFLIAIDESQVEDLEHPVTLDELKIWMCDAVRAEVLTEDFGDPCGFASCEIHIEQLVELTPERVAELYGPQPVERGWVYTNEGEREEVGFCSENEASNAEEALHSFRDYEHEFDIYFRTEDGVLHSVADTNEASDFPYMIWKDGKWSKEE